MGRVLPGLVLALLVGLAAGWAVSTPVGVVVGVVMALTLLPLLRTSDARDGTDPAPNARHDRQLDED